MILTASHIQTPLGPMIAIADEKALYVLEFTDRHAFHSSIQRFQQKMEAQIIEGSTAPNGMIQKELELYFAGHLQKFSTPLALVGSPFQQKVWRELQQIPFGETCSYAQIASAIGQPSAYRAAARANATNRLAIIIPCHRVINTGGKLGGYAGGLSRKEALLDLEKKHSLLSLLLH